MSFSSRTLLVVVALVIIFSIAAVKFLHHNRETPSLSVRVGTLQGGISTLDLMEQEGIARDMGLNLTVLRLQKTPDIIAALAKGDVDAAIIPAEMAARMIEDGQDILIIAVDMLQNQAILSLDPGIKSVEDLKGKIIAATVASGTYKMFKAYAAIVYNTSVVEGGEPQADKIMVVNTPPGSLLDALKRGDVQAIVAWEPIVSEGIVRLGANIVEDYQSLWRKAGMSGDPVMLVWVVKKGFAEENPDVLYLLVKARLKAAKMWVENEEAVVKTLMKLYGLTEEEARTLYGRVKICTTELNDELVDSIRSEWWLAWKGGYLREDPRGIGENVFYRG